MRLDEAHARHPTKRVTGIATTTTTKAASSQPIIAATAATAASSKAVKRRKRRAYRVEPLAVLIRRLVRHRLQRLPQIIVDGRPLKEVPLYEP